MPSDCDLWGETLSKIFWAFDVCLEPCTHTQNPEIRLEALMSASGDAAEKRDDGSNEETLSHAWAL